MRIAPVVVLLVAAPVAAVGATDGAPVIKKVRAALPKVRAVHAEFVIGAGSDSARVSGDFGTRDARLTVRRPDRRVDRYVVVAGTARVSQGGAAWKADDDGFAKAMFSAVVLVMSPASPLYRERFTGVGRLRIRGVETTRLHAATASPIDLWVGSVAGIGTVPFRARFVLSGSDQDAPATVDLSRFNRPFTVSLPAVGSR